MIAKKCIHCQKDFNAKKETRLYCSDSCKVMFNRKNKKEKTKFIKVPIDIWEKLMADSEGKPQFRKSIVASVAPVYDGKETDRVNLDEAGQWEQPNQKSSEPIREEGENAIDFAVRKTQWKLNN